MFLSKKLYVGDCRKSQLIGFNPYLYWEESSKEEGVYCGVCSLQFKWCCRNKRYKEKKRNFRLVMNADSWSFWNMVIWFVENGSLWSVLQLISSYTLDLPLLLAGVSGFPPPSHCFSGHLNIHFQSRSSVSELP